MLGKEEQVEFEKEPQEPKKGKKKANLIKDVLTGSMLAKKTVTGQLPYIFFLVFLALVYIGNRYRTERIVNESTQMQKEVENLRSESITTAAELMNISKQSEVARMVKEQGLGIEESVKPPQLIKKSAW
jgi:hypothetical protein